MSYSIFFEDAAESRLNKILRKVQPAIAAAIERAIDGLAANPRGPACRPLVGGREKAWRLRCGMYRVLYTIDDRAQTVRVYEIALRPDAY